MGDHLDNFPVLYSLGSQAGVVDINHAFYLYYKIWSTAHIQPTYRPHTAHIQHNFNVVCGLCFCLSQTDFVGFLRALWFPPSSNQLPFYRATNLVIAFQLTFICYAIQNLIKSIMKRVTVLTIGKTCKVDQPVHRWNASAPSNRELYVANLTLLWKFCHKQLSQLSRTDMFYSGIRQYSQPYVRNGMEVPLISRFKKLYQLSTQSNHSKPIFATTVSPFLSDISKNLRWH